MSNVLTVREAGKFLGLHANTVRLYAKTGRIPAARIGRIWRFVEADLVAWLRERYPDNARMQPSATEQEAIWHSGNVQVSTMSTSLPRTERELDALLEQPTGKKRRSITTS